MKILLLLLPLAGILAWALLDTPSYARFGGLLWLPYLAAGGFVLRRLARIARQAPYT